MVNMMKNIKTATITFHAPENSGAFLQAYALHHYILESLDLENEIIDFQAEAQKKQYSLFHTQKGLRGILRDICNCLHYSEMQSRKHKYMCLRKKYLKCTSELQEINEVLKEALRFDVLICGSDQIWNAELNDFSSVYYLPGIRNKISYACSLGKNISEESKRYFRQYMEEFSAISVREKSSAESLENEFDTVVACCVDPTLLVGRNTYEKIITEEKITVPPEYIFLYSVKFHDYILEIAEQLSQEQGLPVYTVLSTPSAYAGIRARKHGIHVDYSGGPAEFLTYIKNASLVISDSFHGIVFSTIFHTPFLRTQMSVAGRIEKDERLDSFLNMVGLSDRIIVSNQKDMCFNSEINWELTDRRLNLLSSKSGAWLKTEIVKVFGKNKNCEIPKLFDNKKNCCGCGACYSICPTKSIIMVSDEEGFEYPLINSHTCVGCNSCLRACSFISDQEKKGML